MKKVFACLTVLYHKRVKHQLHHDNMNVLLSESFLGQPKKSFQVLIKFFFNKNSTVSHICNFICFPSIVIIRAPNSTPK